MGARQRIRTAATSGMTFPAISGPFTATVAAQGMPPMTQGESARKQETFR